MKIRKAEVTRSTPAPVAVPVFRQRLVPLTVIAAMFGALAACGESDLAQLQIDEINAAQEKINQANTANNGDENSAPALGPDQEETPPENQTPEDQNPENQPPENQTPENEPPVNQKTAVETLLENHSLVFSDEFDSAQLDDTRWTTRYQWGPDVIVNDELQYYVDSQTNPDFGIDPFSFTGEALVLTARNSPEDLKASANDQSYLSGVMTTNTKFSFTYGYAEIRAKLPAGKGFWPGFWMLGESFEGLKPQMFVMEGRGDDTNHVYHRYNYSDSDGEFQYSDLLRSEVNDFSSEFHTYGVQWTPDSLTFYVDGESQQQIAHDSIAAQDMYLILNLAVGGWFADSPDDSTVFPAEFVIDYVRVYQQSE